MRLVRAAVGIGAALVMPLGLSAQVVDSAVPGHLARIGLRVQEYFDRVQRLVCRETVRLQPLKSDLMPDGRARELVYELRVDWMPPASGGPPEATIQRELLLVDGRPPQPGDEPGCMDPKAFSPEPLAMLLPERQPGFAFRRVGDERIDGRPSVLLDYRPVAADPPTVTWRGDCVSVELLSMTRGRVWADAANGDVLRLDESLTGLYEFPVPERLQRGGGPRSLIIERSDTTIRYRPITFSEPDETLLLPASIETLTIVRRAGIPRQRITQTFSDYRRFITSGRIVQ